MEEGTGSDTIVAKKHNFYVDSTGGVWLESGTAQYGCLWCGLRRRNQRRREHDQISEHQHTAYSASASRRLDNRRIRRQQIEW